MWGLSYILWCSSWKSAPSWFNVWLYIGQAIVLMKLALIVNFCSICNWRSIESCLSYHIVVDNDWRTCRSTTRPHGKWGGMLSSNGLWAVRTLCGSDVKARVVTPSALLWVPLMMTSGLWVTHCEIFSPHAEALDDGQLEVENKLISWTLFCSLMSWLSRYANRWAWSDYLWGVFICSQVFTSTT